VEHGRPGGVGRRPGLGGSSATGHGRGLACVTGAAPAGAGCARQPGPGVAGAVACVEAMREREAGERKGEPGYYTRLCLSGRHIRSADEHKRAGLCGGCGTLCSSATRRI
jgi:hypothetical protein